MESIPEMIERLRVRLDLHESRDEMQVAELNDLVNVTFGLIQALANFVSPIIGSLFVINFGVGSSFDFVFLINVIFAVYLATCHCGLEVLKENRLFKSRLSILLSPVEIADQQMTEKAELSEWRSHHTIVQSLADSLLHHKQSS